MLIKIYVSLMLLVGFASYSQASALNEKPFRSGEIMHFNVKWNGIGIGSVKIHFEGFQEWQGQSVYKVVSVGKMVKYEGVDEIYADPTSFLPLYVRRKLTFMGNDEVIEEFYDQEKFEVKIVKMVGGVREEKVIRKKGPLTNSILLCYLARMKDLKKESSFDVRLPTKDYTFRIQKGGQQYKQETFLFWSSPRGIRIWIGEESPHIPLKMVFTKPSSIVTMIFQKLTYKA